MWFVNSSKQWHLVFVVGWQPTFHRQEDRNEHKGPGFRAPKKKKETPGKHVNLVMQNVWELPDCLALQDGPYKNKSYK